MSTETHNTESRNSVESLRGQFSEDPRREPHEKETAIHLEGDATRASVTSFKQVVYAKWLQHPEFEVKRLNVRDEEGRERTVQSLEEVRENPALTVIGASGTLPVGCLSIGAARNSDSHAEIVKP
jgi:hypothetical protein